MNNFWQIYWTKNVKMALVILSGVIFLSGCGLRKSAVLIETEIIDTEEVATVIETEVTGTEMDQADSATEDESAKVCIYVCGAVANPGVYELTRADRVNDALEMAGGFTTDADKEYVNLAVKVTDEEKIYFPTKEEAKELRAAEAASQDQAEVELDGGDEEASAVTADGLVNINRASVAELTGVPGIGESKAKKIVDYRDSNGSFNSIEDIMNVSGIKEGTYNNIKEYITVD